MNENGKQDIRAWERGGTHTQSGRRRTHDPPKRIREQLGIEPNEETPASLVGSVLDLNPKPSAKLEPATAGRQEWEGSTAIDAGAGLFGPMSEHDQ